MMDLIALIPSIYNPNAFSSLSTASESIYEAPKKIEVLDFFVTQFPRLSEEDSMPTQFAFTYFDDARVDLMKNQDSVQFVSNELLGHTMPLGDFEQKVLNKSYVKSLKSVPSRANRL